MVIESLYNIIHLSKNRNLPALIEGLPFERCHSWRWCNSHTDTDITAANHPCLISLQPQYRRAICALRRDSFAQSGRDIRVLVPWSHLWKWCWVSPVPVSSLSSTSRPPVSMAVTLLAEALKHRAYTQDKVTKNNSYFRGRISFFTIYWWAAICQPLTANTWALSVSPVQVQVGDAVTHGGGLHAAAVLYVMCHK